MGDVADSIDKQVVDEVSGWLRVFSDGTVDRTWKGPPEALFLMSPVPPYDVPRDGVTVHDIPGDPTLRVYIPDRQGMGPLPVLLHFHGGGFCISHATWLMYHQFYSRLASAIPAVIVSPFLPLAPEHRLPAAVDTCYSALIFLRSLAHHEAHISKADHGSSAVGKLCSASDFSRVFLIGDSSGGNLVHQVASRAGQAQDGFFRPLRLAGCIPIHPGFVRSARSTSELECKQDAFLTLDMLDKFLAYSLPKGSTKDHPVTCPMGKEAPALEGLTLPPFLVMVAECDLIRDTNVEYCEAMRKAGKEIEVLVSEGVGHSFYLNKFALDNDPITGKRTQELIVAVKDFVDRH